METTQPAGDPAPHIHTGAGSPRVSGSASSCPDPSRPAGQPERPRVRVGSPASLLAVVPHLLGFHPERSFVVIGATGPRDQFELGFRYDLPDQPDPAAAAQIADHAVAILGHRRITTVIGVGYGPGRLVTPVADSFTAAVRRGSFRLHELLRVEDGRYWSYLCGNLGCCPPEGVTFDYRSHPAAAVMTAAGLAAHKDREALARTLAPVTGEAAKIMDRALDEASARADRLISQARRKGSRNDLRLVIREGRRAVRDAIDTYRSGGRITDERKLAWLMVVLASLPVRDDAWARMLPDYREAHLAMWTDVVRRATRLWLPAPASLLAFTAWQAGEGALANIALERALAADPGYSMALLLCEILASGAPPSAARLPMTPKEVAQSYARADQRAAGRAPAPGSGIHATAPGRGVRPPVPGLGVRPPAPDRGVCLRTPDKAVRPPAPDKEENE
jgi:Domain of unknown function (DUF4192)